MKEIRIDFPDRAFFPLDPRKIQTIGDQVISEHIFGFHSKDSFSKGFSSSLSKIEFDSTNNKIRVTPRFEILDSSGKKFSTAKICESLVTSLKGTSHANYPDIFKNFHCAESYVEIFLNYLPVNLKFLFTTPDYSLFDQDLLPIQGTGQVATTGPYYFSDQNDGERVNLKLNPNYPKALRANSVENVSFNTYYEIRQPEAPDFWNPEINHLIYFFSIHLGRSYLEHLEKKGYRIRINPSEGVLFLNFSERVSLADRLAISSVVDLIRNDIIDGSDFLTAAYSMQPSDRGYGLTESKYKEIVSQSSAGAQRRPSRKLILGCSESYYKIPTIGKILDMIEHASGNQVELRLYKRGEIDKFNSEVDFNLEFMGLSQADPLTHYFYLSKFFPAFEKILNQESLKNLAVTIDPKLFSEMVIKLETTLAKDRIYVPIGHYPGIVAESPLLERDEHLQASWGTAAWTYRVR